jgi:Mn-dependent DtxR family transcriptional regulator
MIKVPSENIYKEVEGIEHHIGKETAFCISTLLQFFDEIIDKKDAYFEFRKSQK